MSHWEFEIVAALAFVFALVYARVDWRRARGGEIIGFLLVYGIMFWPVLIGWWLVRTLVLAVG